MFDELEIGTPGAPHRPAPAPDPAASQDPFPADAPAATPEVLPALDAMELVQVHPDRIAQAFASPDALRPILDTLAAKVKAIPTDITTKKGREACASLAFQVGRAKNHLEKLGKDYSAELKAMPKKVDATRAAYWDFLEALQTEVRAPLTAWEALQEEQKAKLAQIQGLPDACAILAVEKIVTTIDRLCEYDPPAAWDRRAEILAAKGEALGKLEALLVSKRQAEEDARELARLRQEKEAREAEERQKAEQERIRKEAAEKELQAAALREQEARDATARAEQEARDAEERARLAEMKAAREREDAADRARLAAKAAEEREEQARVEAAQAERRRIAEEQQKASDAAAARERDKEHRKAVNVAAMQDLIANAGLTPDQARATVIAIAQKTISHVAIAY